MNLSRFEITQAVLADLRHSWKQMLIIDLIARAFALIVLAPTVALLLKVFLLTADDGVLTDTDIARFALHPLGALTFLLIGAVSLGTLFAEVGTLMVLAIGRQRSPNYSWRDAVQRTATRVRPLLRLAGRTLVRFIVLWLPAGLALGLIWVSLLSDYDINYYLAENPPEFTRALVLAAVVGVISLLITITVASGWIFSLPMVLFEHQSALGALRASTAATRSQRGRLSLAVAAAGLVTAASWIGISALLGQIATFIVPSTLDYPALAAVSLLVALILMGVGSFAVSVFFTVALPLSIVRLYERWFDLQLSHSEGFAVEPAGRSKRRPVSVPFALAALTLAATFSTYLFTRGMGSEIEPQIIAHRGASAAAPENTLAAFEFAIEEGTDWIELDVQEGADGRVLVAHDSDFMKVAANPLKVWEATPANLADLDIGGWFGREFASQRTPTLEEALDLARGRSRVLIELKYYGHDQLLEQRVIDLVEQARMVDQVAIMSLKLDGIRRSEELRPDWPHGLLNTASLGDLTRLDVDFLALNASAATRGLIRRAHSRGLEVFVWTLNDPIQMSVMLSRGIDGIITDRPQLAAQVIELRRNLSPFGRVLLWIAGEAGLLQSRAPSSSASDA